MKKYIVPPSNQVNPVERYDNGKWTRIAHLDVKKGDILKVYDHTYKPMEAGRNGIVLATSDGYENEDGIATFQCEIDEDKIPNL